MVWRRGHRRKSWGEEFPSVFGRRGASEAGAQAVVEAGHRANGTIDDRFGRLVGAPAHVGEGTGGRASPRGSVKEALRARWPMWGKAPAGRRSFCRSVEGAHAAKGPPSLK